MANTNVIPNTHPNLVVVERIQVQLESGEVALETRQIPIVGWFVDTEDYERYNFFFGSPVCIDDLHDGRWAILNTTTGQVTNQFEATYNALADFEEEMDQIINLERFVYEK